MLDIYTSIYLNIHVQQRAMESSFDLTGRAFKDIGYRELARMGSGLSDPRRLEVLDLICQAEKAVETAASESRQTGAAASHHLRALRDAGLAASRKEGRFVFYRATPAGRRLWLALSSLGEEHSAEIREAMRAFFAPETELDAITPAVLLRKVRERRLTLIDVRPEEEYAAGHLEGAVSIPLPELERMLESLPRSRPVAAYCRGRLCVMSKEAVQLLRDRGFKAFRLKLSPLDLDTQV